MIVKEISSVTCSSSGVGRSEAPSSKSTTSLPDSSTSIHEMETKRLPAPGSRLEGYTSSTAGGTP